MPLSAHVGPFVREERGFFAGFCPSPICPNWGGVGNAVPAEGENCERTVGRRLRPPGRPSTIPGAKNVSMSQIARLCRWLRP